MKLRLIISTLLALEIADGRNLRRGTKRARRKRLFAGAMRRCYPHFEEYEDCLISRDSYCEDVRDEYFACMYEDVDEDGFLDCELSLSDQTEEDTEEISSPNTYKEATEERSTFNTYSNLTSSSFGTEMFELLCNENPDANVLFSPLSVYRALELVEDGATVSSDNRAELDALLGPQELREQVKALQGFDTMGGDVQLNMATSIWANDLKEDYMKHMITEHSAEAFDLPETYAPVDDWIENKTNGMIEELMGDAELDPLTRALLVDAVYFKGTWTYSFDSNENVEGTFYYRDDSDTEVTFMKASRPMEVAKTPLLGNASLVALDYGSDAEFSALFILPESSDVESMDEVIVGLNSQPLSELIEELTEESVELKLPRFHLGFGQTQLKPILESMGMNVAFDPNVLGKFNRMSYDRELYVKDVHHGACMDVNEEGTEAAAATVVVVATRSRPREVPIQITFDRPFVVVIMQRSSGIPLFIGRVEEPDFT